jgi:hypothetical protein
MFTIQMKFLARTKDLNAQIEAGTEERTKKTKNPTKNGIIVPDIYHGQPCWLPQTFEFIE